MDYNFKSDVSQKENSKTTSKNLLKKIDKEFDQKPTPAFIGASWIALFSGMLAYCIGLWNSDMQLNEKGYYFTILLFGLFAAISVQKSVRDRLEGLQVTDLYYSISWFSTLSSIVLLTIGLWNANLLPSEKGFYAISFLLSLFASIAVQKNTRDKKYIETRETSTMNE